MLHVFIDGDGCPVKEEVYRVARRYGLRVTVVANSRMRVPAESFVELAVVSGSFDAADDWIVERAGRDDVVVTADVVLASRCLKRGARVIDPRGRLYSESSIGDDLLSRDIASHLRDLGEVTRGPSPFIRKDRSRFLQRLDEVVNAIRHARGPKGEGDS